MSVPDGTGPQCEGSSGERRASPTHRSKRERGSGGRQGWGRRNPLTPASGHAPVPAAGSPTRPALGSLRSPGNTAASPVPAPAALAAAPRAALASPAARRGCCWPGPATPLSPSPCPALPPKAEKGAHVWPLPSWGCGDASRQVNVCSLLPWQKGMSPPP